MISHEEPYSTGSHTLCHRKETLGIIGSYYMVEVSPRGLGPGRDFQMHHVRIILYVSLSGGHPTFPPSGRNSVASRLKK